VSCCRYASSPSCVGWSYYERLMDRDCEQSEWSAWSNCEGNTCGTGTQVWLRLCCICLALVQRFLPRQTRTRTITRNATMMGYGCGPNEELKECNATSEWSDAPPTPSDVLSSWFGSSIAGSLAQSSTQIVQLTGVGSLGLCAEECAAYDGCVSFDFNEYYQYCKLRNARESDDDVDSYCTYVGFPIRCQRL